MVLSAVVARTPHVGVGDGWIEVVCAVLGGRSRGSDLILATRPGGTHLMLTVVC